MTAFSYKLETKKFLTKKNLEKRIVLVILLLSVFAGCVGNSSYNEDDCIVNYYEIDGVNFTISGGELVNIQGKEVNCDEEHLCRKCYEKEALK